MSILSKLSGVHASTSSVYARVSGTQTIVDEVFVKEDGVWVSFHKNVIEKLLNSTTNAVIADLFTPEEWASTTPKLVTIPAHQTIGSNDNTLPALKTGTGGGGVITIENLGEIQGAGGDANSGVGGDAFDAEQAVTLINRGAIRAGGGGGGSGGVGGNGSYTETETQGPLYAHPGAYKVWYVYYDYSYFWGSIYRFAVTRSSTISHGGWTYRHGRTRFSDGTSIISEIIRSRSVTRYSTGGTGGDGGRGIGYDAVKAVGVASSAGGVNAGAGGTGGTGGTWGTTGSAGATGANGNYTNGVAGSAGGLSGHALKALTNITLTNTGTIQGIQA